MTFAGERAKRPAYEWMFGILALDAQCVGLQQPRRPRAPAPHQHQADDEQERNARPDDGLGHILQEIGVEEIGQCSAQHRRRGEQAGDAFDLLVDIVDHGGLLPVHVTATW